MNFNDTVRSLVESYGDGADGHAPTPAQWQRILQREPNKPFSLVNFFKFHQTADYGDELAPAATGREAFQRYADVSVPSMHGAGGEFLAVAPFAGSLFGQDQDWDLIAIGKYPNLDVFMSLYSNPEYIKAFRHRTAAVARQFVVAMEH
ncbi:DUF1330 domain-containing protein [Tateyamaria omphalii]|uniref:DUF1330 domain-containing protein n=1 Tax=Tateyamaria omphalii TaxID=299262 RepID=UPI001C99D993|nr:DUF1330 domain-containing protein [Tateyamaria omphalii]MBY5934750.1 DUF1330 domain-containing protein [Tateyamaria omphalii]